MARPWSVEIHAVGLAACRTTVWRYRGQLRVTAVAKATFSFVHGEAMAMEEPDEIFVHDAHLDGDAARSLYAASELAPYRLVADVVLVGHAHVGSGGAVRLAVFHDHALVDKRIVVARDVAARPLPLVYERAYGGRGSEDNPVGVGLSGAAMPDLIDPASPARAIGFGPVAASWPARARLLGGLDLGAGGPLDVPSDFDWAYFQAAPPDQTTEFLRGDEWIRLEGMDPELPVLQTRLPGAAAAGRVYGLTPGRAQTLAFRADNLHVDADRGRCSVTWRASFSVPGEETLPDLVILAGVEIGGHAIRWPESVAIQAPAPAPAPPPQEEDAEFGMATIAFAPPEGVAPEAAQAPPVRERQATVLLDWGEQGVPAAPPPAAPPAPGPQRTVLLQWGDGGPPPAAPPPRERQGTVILDWGDGGAPPAAPPPQRQSTVLLQWAADPPAPTERLHVSAAGVAIPDDHPLMGTMALTDEQAATPMPVRSPFRITEPGAPRAPRPLDIPGSPWAAIVPPIVPRPIEDERTHAVAIGALLPDDLVDDADDYLPTEKIRIKPAAQPDPLPPPEPPPPAEPDKGGAAGRAWSWATVAEPPRAPAVKAPPPQPPPPTAAVKSSLYGKFGSQTKKR